MLSIKSQRGWIAHTTKGPWFVPGDVVPVPDVLPEDYELDTGWLQLAAINALEKYAGIENIVSVETVSGFFVHMSVLGSRKNEWALFATEQEMLDEVCEARIQADL